MRRYCVVGAVACFGFVELLLPQLGVEAAVVPLHTDGLVIDTFKKGAFNDLGAWHGPGEDLPLEYGDGYVRFSPTNPDHNFNTQFSPSCFDLRGYNHMYLHVSFSGTNKFSISLNQHNEDCDPHRSPYPETWDTVEAARYANGNDIYVPLEHFIIDKSRAISISFHGFYTTEDLALFKVEIVPHIPHDFKVPKKLPSGTVLLKCKRPNSFAFGIDDGQPWFAQEVMRILEEEDILVTFFVVAGGLTNEETNFTAVYNEMLRRGHQVALHSYTHPKMEGLATIDEIDRELAGSMAVFENMLGVESRYFRPPYGTIGARTRQRLASLIDDPYIINWSVDIEDWLYANSDTPEKQFEAFKRDVRRGGNLAVMHYLHPTTVGYFRDVINVAKAAGKQIMRVDQCMEDPDAPPLPGDRRQLNETELPRNAVY